MPLSAEAWEAMREYMAWYEAMYKGLEPDWYLFPARWVGNGKMGFWLNTERPIVKMAAIVQKALIAAGHTIEKGEGVHTLRRSVARIFFDKACASGHDAALRMTSSLLHHASTQVTEGYLGLQHERLTRDEVLRGKQFLTKETVELKQIAV
jgi:site-specific recombinase XerD